MKKFTILVISVIFSIYSYTQDTFSIVAVDTVTGEVGSAGASCLDDDDIEGGVLIISDVHPGVGAIHTQSYWHPSNQQYAKQLMNDGFSPQQIIDSLVANDVQNNPGIRQYGVVDLFGESARSAAFTGENCLDHKNHITGPNFAIQGNILLGQQILDSMEARFLNTEGELVCKLMAALQGANVAGADTRCLSNGTSSLSAFVRVAKPDDDEDSLYVDFRVPKVFPGAEPIDQLQTIVDNWGGCIDTQIEETDTEGSIRVFPNPAVHAVTFEFLPQNSLEGLTISIFDSRGAKIREFSGLSAPTLSWNTDEVSPGIYVYRVIRDGVAVGDGKILIE